MTTPTFRPIVQQVRRSKSHPDTCVCGTCGIRIGDLQDDGVLLVPLLTRCKVDGREFYQLSGRTKRALTHGWKTEKHLVRQHADLGPDALPVRCHGCGTWNAMELKEDQP